VIYCPYPAQPVLSNALSISDSQEEARLSRLCLNCTCCRRQLFERNTPFAVACAAVAAAHRVRGGAERLRHDYCRAAAAKRRLLRNAASAFVTPGMKPVTKKAIIWESTFQRKINAACKNDKKYNYLCRSCVCASPSFCSTF